MKRIFLLTCAALVCASCGGQKNKRAGADTTNGNTADSTAPVVYKLEIPAIITEPEEQARWAVEHYWDRFAFADTTAVARWGDYAEQAFVNFLDQVLVRIPPDMGDRAVVVLFDRAAANKPVFDRMAEIAEKYLFDPNSPFRNEDLYIFSLRAILANPALDEWERIRPQEQLRLALKNRVGDRAADFRYTLASGATGTLHNLRARYTILFFNNPGCPTCRDMMEQIMTSPFLVNRIEQGALAVLAVYPDEDLAAWREYLSGMPQSWIVSYDATQTIENDELYDLKAIPTIYLLDEGKRVMLKDVMSIPLIEQTIYDNEQQQ